MKKKIKSRSIADDMLYRVYAEAFTFTSGPVKSSTYILYIHRRAKEFEL